MNSCRFAESFRRISRLGSAFMTLRLFKLLHISVFKSLVSPKTTKSNLSANIFPYYYAPAVLKSASNSYR